MGGIGSGRPSGSGRTTVEMCRSLDVNRLNKAGVLVPGWFGGWEWKRDGDSIASIGIRGGREQITLVYRWKRGDADWQDVVEPIRIHWRPCRYGGSRPFFSCPGIVSGIACNRPVVKLYCAGRYYLCRHCYRLSYASRREEHWDRALRRANRIRVRLGGEPGMASPYPRRPCGMWRRTYDRLMQEIFAAEEVADEKLAVMALRLMSFDSSEKRRGSRRKGKFWP